MTRARAVLIGLLVASSTACSNDAKTDDRAARGPTGDLPRNAEADSPVGRGSESSLEIPADAPFWFVDEAAARGITGVNHTGEPSPKRYLIEEIGCGAAFFDCDGDGDLDLYVVDGCTLLPPGRVPEGVAPDLLPPHADQDWLPAFDGQSRLYLNDGRGYFEDVTEQSGASYRGMGCGATAADYDGDGDVDLYVTCWGPNRLFANDGHGRFTDVTRTAGVGDPHWSVASCWLDYDHDGDLDLFVSNYFSMSSAVDPEVWKKVDCPYLDLKAACGPKTMVPEPDTLYRNRGDGTFEDVSDAENLHSVEPSYGLGAVAFDYDQDGETDIFVANDSRPNNLFRNTGHGFKEIADLVAVAVNAAGIAQAGMGVACGDFDHDGDLDLHLTNFSHDNNTMYRNEKNGRFTDVTMRMNFGQATYFALGWGTELVDFDLDGDSDLFAANGHLYPEVDLLAPDVTYKQLNRVHSYDGVRYNDCTQASGPGLARLASSRGAAFGDVDRDGDVDVLVVAINEAPSLLINHTPRRGRHFAIVELEGVSCNRHGLGAQVFLTVGDRTSVQEVQAGHSFASMNDTRLHFGLGEATRIDRLMVRWPGGAREEWNDLPGDRCIHLRQGEAKASILPWTSADRVAGR